MGGVNGGGVGYPPLCVRSSGGVMAMMFNICLWIVCSVIVFALIGCTNAPHNGIVATAAVLVAMCERDPIKAIDIMGDFKWQ